MRKDKETKKENKLKIAIFDLTDCEGCELQIINLKEKLITILNQAEIVAWRLVQEKNSSGPFDISLVEGSAQTDEEINLLKNLRERSNYLIALGSCATIGGIPSIVGEAKERKKLFQLIYGPKYKPKAKTSKPIDNYVPVDFYLHGCPVSFSELERVFTYLLSGRIPEKLPYPVCLECKIKENECLLIKNKPCLGPITQAGCQAICITEGKYCYGCQGPTKEANIKALKNRFGQFLKKQETEKYLNLFLKDTKEYQKWQKK